MKKRSPDEMGIFVWLWFWAAFVFGFLFMVIPVLGEIVLDAAAARLYRLRPKRAR